MAYNPKYVTTYKHTAPYGDYDLEIEPFGDTGEIATKNSKILVCVLITKLKKWQCKNADTSKGKLTISDIIDLSTNFEKDINELINTYSSKGLKKSDLVHKMKYITKSCELS